MQRNRDWLTESALKLSMNVVRLEKLALPVTEIQGRPTEENP